MHNGRWAEEPFLASIGLLSDGGVETDDGSHRNDPASVLGDLFADNASDFGVIVFVVRCGLQLAFASNLWGVGTRSAIRPGAGKSVV